MNRQDTKAAYQARVKATAIRIINSCYSDSDDELTALCGDGTDNAAMTFASDVYNFMLDEMGRRGRPSIARHL